MISLDIQSDVFERLSNAFFDSLKFKCPTAADHNITPNDPCTSIPKELANILASTSSVRNQSGLSLFLKEQLLLPHQNPVALQGIKSLPLLPHLETKIQ